PVFAAPGTTTVLHAGDNDLVHLKRRHGMSFAALFDTHVAARFLGEPALGLDVIIRRYLGLELPPSRQRDDWSARPLTEAQRDYAAADVLHLFGLKDRLVDELRRVERLAWVEEECAALASQAVAERPPDPNAFASGSGAPRRLRARAWSPASSCRTVSSARLPRRARGTSRSWRRWRACDAGAPRPSAPKSLQPSPRRENVHLHMTDWRQNLVDDD